MHFCSPPFRLSKAPKRSAIPASGNSEKHVAIQIGRHVLQVDIGRHDFEVGTLDVMFFELGHLHWKMDQNK
jgi:hypothetical protein